MIKVVSGVKNRAKRVVLYGSEGLGKSTLASKFPDPVFIDLEDGTSTMDVSRIEGISSWADLLKTVAAVAASQPKICETLVIDTADRAENYCIADVCNKYNQPGLEAFSYGKGYTYVGEEFGFMLKELDAVIAAGINVVIIAHAKMRKFEQPDEAGSYDRWEMKLTRQVAPLLKEWCDLLLFLNYKTFVVTTEDNKNKVQGGKRVMFASHHPCWDAKNRHGLPDEMELDYASIAHLFEEENLHKKLDSLMNEAGIDESTIRSLIAQKGHFEESVPISEYPDDFILRWILPNWDKIVTAIKANQ